MKMSDALRGAAENAPVDDVHVSTGVAASRVKRNRAIRGGANGLVGVGAAALVVAGIVGALANQGGIATPEAAGAGDRDGTKTSDQGITEPGPAGGIMLACGYKFDLSAYPTGAVTAVATLGDVADGAVPVEVAFAASEGSYTVDAPGVFVIWDGIVVGNPGVAADGAVTAVSADSPATVSGGADLVNCWDGTALPAGDYTVVTVTPLTDAATEVPPVEEPTTSPEPLEPSTEPGDPDASVSSDVAGDATDIAVEAPIYAVSDAVDLTISGDAVENPFDSYLNPDEPVTPAAPDDALTADAAREAYLAALAGKWDMAVGTQRVLLTGDGKQPEKDLWTSSYYGCSMDGSDTAFPSTSAELSWIDVAADLPSTIGVSYGWVVNNNPLVGYTVKNVSEWSLPGFYAGSSPRLYLVQDGRVVAEAYPVNVEQNGGAIAYSSERAVADEDNKLIWAPENEYLAPGEVQDGDYLWRDVNGCWSGDAQTAVEAGTYTVLSAQDLYFGGAYSVMEGDPAAIERTEATTDLGSGDDAADTGADAPISAPAPDIADYASFQVWTSLGTVTVTN